jgi:dihydrodipicolinate synthase/N-acetylneuraminate lyase
MAALGLVYAEAVELITELSEFGRSGNAGAVVDDVASGVRGFAAVMALNVGVESVEVAKECVSRELRRASERI